MDGCECGKQSERAGETKKVASYLGLKSERGVFGRTAAHGSDQQVGQHDAALAAKNGDAPQRSTQPVRDPEDSDGVERVLEFRKRVAQEFELIGRNPHNQNRIKGRCRRRGELVGRREIDAPEMRARQEKFDSDVHAFIRQRSAQGNNSTWLLFFGVTIGEEKLSADFDRLLKEKQTAVRVDHDRLGILAEVLAIGVLARSAHGYIDPYSQAAAPSLDLCF